MEPRRWSAVAAATPGGPPRQGRPPQNMPGGKKAFPADRSIVIIAMALGALAGLNLDRDEAFESDARAASVGDCLQSSGLKAGSRDEGHCFT
ncbi:hypothetical protein ABZS68_09990 [Streptomyces sp. NPDC005571]|uniref:hypothetical protein n=2 Tax=Streptomyces TaxID=1883 RepID=UPI0033A49952